MESKERYLNSLLKHTKSKQIKASRTSETERQLDKESLETNCV